MQQRLPQQQQRHPNTTTITLLFSCCLLLLATTTTYTQAFLLPHQPRCPHSSTTSTRTKTTTLKMNQHHQPDPSPSPFPTLTRIELLKRTFLTTATSTFAFLLNKQPSFAADKDAAPTTEAETPAAPAAPTEATPPAKSVKTAYDYAIPYNGERVPLEKFRGKAVVVCNAKSDDPEALNQMPALAYLNGKHSKEGLKVWVFTTEQGTFETDEDRVIRIKFYQQYGYGQYPTAVVFDKIDIVGKRADPFYKYLCRTLKNPNKIARITLNFEKFLLDADGRPLRRYPRKYTGYDMEEDVKAALAGKPLPPPSPKLIKAWRDAYTEAERSEYAFKKGLNYYEPLGEDQRNLP